MQNQNQFIRHTAAVLMACGLIASLLPGFAAAQDLPAQTQTSVGDYVSHAVSGNHIHFALEGGARVRVELCRTDLARIRMVPPGQEFISNEPYIIARYDWPAVGGTVTDEDCAVFVRGGAIIPMMPYMNYVGEKPIDPLIVDIYGHGSTEFTLFEDDGESFDYEKGGYCETKFENHGGTEIVINARNCPGSYKPTERSYLFRMHHDVDPGTVYLGEKALGKKIFTG